MSNYRCRVHPDQEVTWRGTGCPECEPPATNRRRVTKRTADYPMELSMVGINDGE